MDKFMMILFFLLLSSNSCALTCEGEFEQNMVVEDKEWTWVYSIENQFIFGETLLHMEHDSFSIIGGEDEGCLKSNTCPVSALVCAVSIALIEPSNRQLSVGRIQMKSKGLYLMASDAVRKIKDCDRAYSEYYLEISKFWKQHLSASSKLYQVTKVHSRDIKLDKPIDIGDKCFEDLSRLPKLWSGIDYFPVVTIELIPKLIKNGSKEE